MSPTQRLGWLNRQRQARQAGWRVWVHHMNDGGRELRVQRRDQLGPLWKSITIVLLAALVTSALLGVTIANRSSPLASVWGVMMLLAMFVTRLLVAIELQLEELEEHDWSDVPIDTPEPSLSSTAIAVTLDGVRPIRRKVPPRQTWYVPAERVPTLESAFVQTQCARHADRETRQAEETRRRTDEIIASNEADQQFLDDLRKSPPRNRSSARHIRGDS